MWRELRSTADSLEPPAGFRQVGRSELGTTSCVITCGGYGEAEIRLLFATEMTSDQQICSAFVEPVARIASAPPQPPPEDLTGCLIAPVAAIRDRANVRVFVTTLGPYGPAANLDREDLFVEVVISSGIE